MDFNPDEIKPFILEDFALEEAEEATEESEEGEVPQEAVSEEEDEKSRTKKSPDKSASFTTAFFSSGNAPAVREPTAEEAEKAIEDQKIEKSENFDSQDFTIEASLLTNAEDYANTIREGARIYSDRVHKEADAIHEKARKTLEEAEAAKREVEGEKEEQIKAAQADVQRIKEAAYQEGFAQGQEAGTQQRYQELAPQVQKINEVLEQLLRLRQIIRFQGEQELLQLALLVAKKVVYEELSVNSDVLYNIVRASLQEIEALGKIRVLINPGDYEFMVKAQAQLESYLKDEQTLVIAANIDAKPGEILIETDETIINFHFQKQFEAMEEILSRRLEERQTQLHEVDMDAHDFAPPAAVSTPQPPTDEILEQTGPSVTGEEMEVPAETPPDDFFEQALQSDALVESDDSETLPAFEDERPEA